MGPSAHELRFPGSQPVSLASSNIGLLKKHRYFVTWKADGTRYMLYITTMGTYLIDRSFNVRRVQMRWPTAAPSGVHGRPLYNPVVLHHGTLLDGEMVVDEDKVSHEQTRRYLAYDIMQLSGEPLRHREFQVPASPTIMLPQNLGFRHRWQNLSGSRVFLSSAKHLALLTTGRLKAFIAFSGLSSRPFLAENVSPV